MFGLKTINGNLAQPICILVQISQQLQSTNIRRYPHAHLLLGQGLCDNSVIREGLKTQSHPFSELLLPVSSSKMVSLQERSLFLLAIQRTHKRRSWGKEKKNVMGPRDSAELSAKSTFISSLVLSLLNPRWQTSWPTLPSEYWIPSFIP